MVTWQDQVKRHIPDFDLLKCDEVRRLCLELTGPNHVDLYLRVAYGNTHVISFIFRMVRDICFPAMPGGLFSLGELAIVDIGNGCWDGIRFRVGDELSGFSLGCAEIAIQEVDVPS